MGGIEDDILIRQIEKIFTFFIRQQNTTSISGFLLSVFSSVNRQDYFPSRASIAPPFQRFTNFIHSNAMMLDVHCSFIQNIQKNSDSELRQFLSILFSSKSNLIRVNLSFYFEFSL